MKPEHNFSLVYTGTQTHMMMPRTTSILITQNLYDILFQYILTPEKETILRNFTEKLHNHIKSRIKAPFSLPLEELNFLNDGLEELKLLNWQQIRVEVFQVVLEKELTPAEEEELWDYFADYAIVNFNSEKKALYVYPYQLVR